MSNLIGMLELQFVASVKLTSVLIHYAISPGNTWAYGISYLVILRRSDICALASQTVSDICLTWPLPPYDYNQASHMIIYMDPGD